MIWERYAKSLCNFDPKKYYVASQAKKLKSREINFIKNADVSFPITENDKNTALEFAPNSNLVIATGGVNQAEFLPKEVERKPLRLIIATTYSWVHNVNGLIWFMESVLPLVLKKFPEVEIELIGKNPPEIFKNNRNIILTGYVDKVQSYLNSASIYIAPLFVGSGIRIKILEAMAMELPVIATSISAEGIFAKESDGLLISNDPEITATNVIRLLDNPSLCRDLGKNARKFVLQNFTWDRSVKIMYDEYMKLLNHSTSLVNKPLDRKK
jgi:glycosyltransferase involved in cell wall biosynthesis